MTPTPTQIAAYLAQAAQVLSQHAASVETATARVRRNGCVDAEAFLALAEAEGVRLRAPASAMLMMAELMAARPEPEPRGHLSSYLVLLAQTLRREADRLGPVKARAAGDLAILVEAVRASLLEQASMALMLACCLDDPSARRDPG